VKGQSEPKSFGIGSKFSIYRPQRTFKEDLLDANVIVKIFEMPELRNGTT
jgi:hypothetical protein